MKDIWYFRRGYSCILIVLLMAFFLVPFFVLAESENLQEEINEGGKTVSLSRGTYTGDATLGKSMRLVGKDKGDVVITGKIIMKDGSKLEKLTIKGGSIYVKSGADVTIKNVAIKNSPRNAIETLGTGKLKIINSNIYRAGSKGMYIQAGKNIEITGSEIYKNKEEGIDIRSNVDGIISGNAIYNNGESGIEVILGKSKLSITGNTIKNNGSSGIATQYYEIANDLGAVKIENNKITNNKKYGIDCAIPSASTSFSGTYWRKSMSLETNAYSGNNISAINRACGVSDSSGVRKNTSIQDLQPESVESDDKIDTSDQQKNEEKIEEEKKKEQEIKGKLENIKNDLTESRNKTEQNISDIKGRSSLELFIFGPKNNELAELKQENNKIKSYRDELKNLSDQIKNGESFYFSSLLGKDIDKELKNQNEVISNQETRFSLIGWLRNLLN
ncbi:right-handed parallel beta-helix repeat-containing protein [Patescibacteria group bacterium]